MIPQAGKQHIYDFFDVFGRLASWSLKNPGHVHGVYLVHLHASVYSLFHRLYGMFPCNFISYLRLHYSMKENLDTFQEVVKPMLEHVRVHPELVTGTQDYELDPSRWKRYEVHDIVIECAKVSLDPRESSCEEGYSSLPDPSSSSSSSSPRPRPPSPPLPHLDLDLDLSSTPHTETLSSTGSSVCTPLSLSLPQLAGHHSSYIQDDDVTWSPSSECGLATPPPEPLLGSTHPLSRTASISGVKCPSPATIPVTQTEENQDGSLPADNNQPQQQQPMAEPEASACPPITEEGGQPEVINNNNKEAIPEELLRPSSSSSSSSQAVLLASTPSHSEPSLGSADQSLPWSFRPCLSPAHHTPYRLEEGGPALFGSALSDQSPAHPDQNPAPPYEPLFQLALPRAASLFVGKKTQEVMEQERGGGAGEREEREEEPACLSPLELLDRLIVHGHEAHDRLSRRLPMPNKSVDWSHFGGKQQSMKAKGSAQGEELQAVRSELLLVYSQLQYERFKRQQHAVRNRRLLRRIINATALEEHNVAMKAQLRLQEVELQALSSSLVAEQRRYTLLQQDTHTHTAQLHTHIQQLLLQQQEERSKSQNLQSELQECQSKLKDLEAELQKANNEAYNAEHQLTQLSLKLSSSEQLQQQIFLMNKQLLLLRETNRVLTQQLERGDTQSSMEASMLQCSVGREFQRLKDSENQHKQKLEAANQRVTELESQLSRKEQLILDQKKLLEDSKAQSRAQLSACESRCVALSRISQALQTEMLQLYSQIDLNTHTHSNTHTHTHTHTQPQEAGGSSRPNGGSVAMPTAQGSRSLGNKPSSSIGIINGGLEPLSTSPLLLLSASSPVESPLAAGSFLEQRARELFSPPEQEEEEEGGEEEEEQEEEPGSPSVGQEAEEAGLEEETHQPPQTEPPSRASAPGPPASGPPAPPQGPPAPPQGPSVPPQGAPAPPQGPPAPPQGPHPRPPASPQGPPPGPRTLTQAVRQRRHELSIMDYDETLPEY
uniref:hamartin-like n=1 Tax=Centroberyx gerrardi TaxID=166262 RepID=UPI003AAC2C7D